MTRAKKPARRCANCGGGWAHHAVDVVEGCWCPACLLLPGSDRCREWQEAEPERRPVDANVVRVGHAHPETALTMAMKVLPRSGSHKRAVYDWLVRKGPQTDDELEYTTGRSHQAVSADRNALMNDGWVVDSGERRKTRYGNDAIVWKAVPVESYARKNPEGFRRNS